MNGPDRHPLFDELVGTTDADGEAGDVRWNFEKFLINRDGTVAARFRTPVKPDEPAVRDAIEKALS